MRTIRECPVVVVGGAGFLGSHLVNHLIDDRNCDVLVLDNLTSGRREFIHPKAKFEHIDITGSEPFLRSLMYQHKAKFVMNYAAMPYIPVSFERPVYTCDVNFMGAMKVVNAAQEVGVEGILQISSAEIYGEGSGDIEQRIYEDRATLQHVGKIDESAPVVPHSSYGVAKAAVDSAVQVRWHEGKTPCIALRQFNAIGPRETHPYVVTTIISQLDKQMGNFCCKDCGGTGEGWKNKGNGDGEGFSPGACTSCDASGWQRLPTAKVCATCNGSGISDTGCCGVCYETQPEKSVTGTVKLGNNSFRDFQYAGDAVRMATELLEKGKWGSVYNMGSESGIKIYALAKLIGKLMGFEEVTVVQDPARIRPWEIWCLCSDNSKLYSVIEARPQVSFEEALRRTIKSFNDCGRKWCWQ